MRAKLIALLAVLLLALAACGEDDDVAEEPEDEPEPVEEDEPDEEEPEEEDEPDAAAEVEVAVADTDLGDVLVDGDGMTLYMFDPDEQGESTCYDDCAANWPPLEGEPTAGDGVDEGLLGTVERDDGAVQATYNDWPLYLWQGDAEPGDATGQGVNDVWWVLEADGEPLRDGADEPEDDEDDGAGGGY